MSIFRIRKTSLRRLSVLVILLLATAVSGSVVVAQEGRLVREKVHGASLKKPSLASRLTEA